MHYEQYWMVEDCPMCGQKDERGKYKGARMSSTTWGHGYSCCSDACGKAFLNSPQYFAAERAKLKFQQSALDSQLRDLEQCERRAQRT